jgi:hypothetical protein
MSGTKLRQNSYLQYTYRFTDHEFVNHQNAPFQFLHIRILWVFKDAPPSDLQRTQRTFESVRDKIALTFPERLREQREHWFEFSHPRPLAP